MAKTLTPMSRRLAIRIGRLAKHIVQSFDTGLSIQHPLPVWTGTVHSCEPVQSREFMADGFHCRPFLFLQTLSFPVRKSLSSKAFRVLDLLRKNGILVHKERMHKLRSVWDFLCTPWSPWSIVELIIGPTLRLALRASPI